MSNCASADGEMQFASARLLEQCLTTENRAHVVENGLEKVVKVNLLFLLLYQIIYLLFISIV